jgi:protein involved in polysaccharide export with SLBB domain
MRHLFFPALILCAIAGRTETLSTAPGDDRFVAGEAATFNIPLDSNSFLKGGYPIDSAGFVDLPVIGRVQVADRTSEEVELFLAQKLSNYLKDTHVHAEPAIRLTLLGNWVRQGQYYVSPQSTVWEAVRMAGGIAGERNLNKLKVMRGSKDIEVPLLDDYSKGMTLAASGVKSGDIFVIPVPRDNTGGWYWFKEGITATASIATIITSVLSLYLTFTLLDKSGNL